MSSTNHPFDVWIHPHVWIRLNEYAKHALPTEIGGLAKVRIEDESVFVEDIHMMKQEATGATFDITSEMIQAFTLKMVQEGREDELPMWRSIVHSHPVGMSPSMSSTDVTAIKRFAEDEDAFSLIISTQRDAESTEMFMHYCANIAGRHVVIHDMPVYVAYSTERLDLGEKLAKNLGAHFGVDKNPLDMKQMTSLCKTFLASKVPHMFREERTKLSADIKAEVATLITKHASTGWSNRSGYSYSGGSRSTGMGGHRSGGLWDDLDAEEEAYYAALASKTPSIEESMYDNVLTLEKKMNDESISKKQRKKAKKAWVSLVSAMNQLIRKDGGIGYMDVVVVSDSKMTPENTHLFTGEHLVDDIHFGAFNCTFYVDKEAFLSDELTLLVPFEERMRQEEDARREAANVISN